MKKLGVVLSGGGIRGMAHIGLLEALREQGVEFDIVAGTSAGALVGTLYARGYSIQQMLHAFQSAPIFSIRHFTLFKPGIIDTIRLKKVIRKHFLDNSFEALEKELYINSTNLKRGTVFSHHSGPLYRPLLASMSLPPVFSPVTIDGEPHSDGGIMDNFPVQLIRDKCDVLLGSYVCPLEDWSVKPLKRSIDLWRRSSELSFYATSQGKFEVCDYIFEPKLLCEISTLDKRDIERAYQIGYETARTEMTALLEVLQADTQVDHQMQKAIAA